MMEKAFKLVWIQGEKRVSALFASDAEAIKAKTWFEGKRNWRTESPQEVSYSKEDGQRHVTAYGFLGAFGYLSPIARISQRI